MGKGKQDQAGERWVVGDYRPVVRLSGAEKLADSQVAPLVAAARGYQTAADEDAAKTIAKSAYTTEERRTMTLLRTMTKGGGDFMVLPWFAVSDVMKNAAKSESFVTQVRPAVPLLNRDSKPKKYELLAGNQATIDANPGTPPEWFESATKFLITEGCIKGDSAVTAQLLAAGITHKDLEVEDGLTTEQARLRLQAFMLRVPVTDRVPVLSIIGVGNWHSNPEWNTLSFRDRDVMVAFDGDLRSNRMVWLQANKMWDLIDRKHGAPKLLDLGGVNAEKDRSVAGFDGKVGLDDYLSHVGTWTDVLKLTENSLPPQPEKSGVDAQPGDYRVNDVGTGVDVFVKIEGFGEPTYRWEEAVPIGGRVKRITSLRSLTDTSVRDGLASPANVTVNPKGDCTIELKWVSSETGAIVTADITGPNTLLGMTPAEWSRGGASIPSSILSHPEWPPRDKAGIGWLKAIKSHRVPDQEHMDGWDTMGWVPTSTGTPVYIIGTQSLGASQEEEADNQPGVTEEAMPRASSYGVNDTYWAYMETDDQEGWKAQVREDIRTAIECFITDPGWNLPAVGAVSLACALRPTLPGRTKVGLFLNGAPAIGKSYLASFIQSFYGAEGGVFTEGSLPASANDTQAAIEHSIARTPLITIDDLAPAKSRNAAERMETMIEATIRASHNGNGKRRGTVDGGQREMSHPRALVVYTAENQLDTVSIRQRLVSIYLSQDSKIKDRDRPLFIASIARSLDNPFARLTAAMIRFWLNIELSETPLQALHREVESPQLRTWREKYDFVAAAMDSEKQNIMDQLAERYGIPAGRSARRAGMFAELFVTLDVLQALALWAGLDPATDPAMAPFFAGTEDNQVLRGAMLKMAAEDLMEQQQRSNSRNLLGAIRNLLEAGKAHLEHPTMAGRPPVSQGANAQAWNRLAGWTFDARSDNWVPRGTPIGYLGTPSDSEDPEDFVALISPQNAFNLAQREHPDLVPPGQKPRDTWNQVWEDEDAAMVHPSYSKPGGPESTVKVRLSGGEKQPENPLLPPRIERHRGVPVRFNQIVPAPDES